MITLPTLGEAYYIVEWGIRLTMLAVVPLRRSPAAAASWLLLIFFLPVPGLLLFTAIGSPRFPAWRVERFESLRGFFRDAAGRMARDAPGAALVPAEVVELAGRLGHLPAVGGNAVQLLDDYDAVIARLVADIDAANEHVRLLSYIFADDATAGRVIAALGRAVDRGVPCHVLVDPVGSYRWLKGTLLALRGQGVRVRRMLPFRLIRGRTRRDMRNHRKLFLIDGKIGYAGSLNIVAKDFRPGVTNRELVARVTGPAVAAMSAIFVSDWFMETEEMLEPALALPAPAGDSILQVLPSGANYPLEGFLTLLTWQVARAEREIVLVTPYFIPDEGLLGALITAVLRGVEVHIVVSEVVDQLLVNLAQSSYYDELLSHGVRIHRYRGFLLHAKAVRIDESLGIVGSSNVDVRSFQLNEEVSLLLLDRPGIEDLARIQKNYIAGSDELTLAEWRARSRMRRFVENGARLVSPLL
ncbi:cardiolipin synthetase 2 [Novosphingobium sp. PhB57]|uniref:cardiolipin synthase n=1 Tax=unclassified Novosphingobium TaxID=2644732 RepID=UPI0010461BFB|nr:MULTISPECIES: cardiolipin synthase [unclassified Novosphingobium]TCU54519.1 cardiolipin synthetase 2 [Novosphingobium sp. PhB57]TDW59639.1 cardiolipin synthetase 2 [Novosphingobium sp. PhB55]